MPGMPESALIVVVYNNFNALSCMNFLGIVAVLFTFFYSKHKDYINFLDLLGPNQLL